MADVQTLPDYPRGLDFQQVWAALMENREQIKETAQIVEKAGIPIMLRAHLIGGHGAAANSG